MKALLNSIIKFAFKCFDGQNSSKQTEGNIGISPLSAYILFSMMGETLPIKEIMKLDDLIGKGGNKHKKKMKKLFKNLTYNPFDEEVNFTTNNFLFLRNDCSLNEKSKETLTEYYNALIDTYDPINADFYLEKINKYVSDSTGGLINNCLTSLPDDLYKIFINTVYFKGEWTNRFYECDTKKGTFHNNKTKTTEVDMMNIKKGFETYQGKDFVAIKLTYKFFNFSMVIVLPNEIENMAELKKRINEETFNEINDNLELSFVNLQMPKFNVKCNTDLSDYMTNDVQNRIRGKFKFEQKVKIEVDELGTVATAVSSGLCFDGGCPKYKRKLGIKIDRPYIFYIVHKYDGEQVSIYTPLFIGLIDNPLSSAN